MLLLKTLIGLVDFVERVTNLTGVGAYLTAILELDCLTLNEDRHTNNLAVLRNEETKEFRLCPISYPMWSALYQLPDCFHLGWSPFEVWPSLIILSALVKSMTCINDLLPRKITKS